MIYNTILQLVASLTNVVGTTYAVLSILKLKPTDLYQAITIDGMDRNDEALLVQKKQARSGISLVIYAWILQVILSIYSITSFRIFLLCMLTYIVITTILCICLFFANKNLEKKYSEVKAKLDKENKDRHIDAHTIIEF